MKDQRLVIISIFSQSGDKDIPVITLLVNFFIALDNAGLVALTFNGVTDKKSSSILIY